MNRIPLLLSISASLLCAQSYTISTVAGRDWPTNGGPALETPFRAPFAAVGDGSNVYISDQAGHRIYRLSGGILTPIAGTGVRGFAGDDGPAIDAQFSNPRGLALDRRGGLFVVDFSNGRIRRINLSTGIVTTVAGAGRVTPVGDGGPATEAGLISDGIAVDAAGNLYISDIAHASVRKVDGAGVISTIAGNGTSGFSGDGAAATRATLGQPQGLALDANGNIFVADTVNLRVRKIDAAGTISTVAGGGGTSTTDTGDGTPATESTLSVPLALAVEPNGDLLILTLRNLRRVSAATGIISLVAGSGNVFGDRGDGAAASTAVFFNPSFVSALPGGDILVTDLGNFRVRVIRNGSINNFAGLPIQTGVRATSAYLYGPTGVAPDIGGGFWIAEGATSRLRSVGADGTLSVRLSTLPVAHISRQGNTFLFTSPPNHLVVSLTGSTLTAVAGGNGAGFSGDGSAANAARLSTPIAAVADERGFIYIVDSGNCRVRVVDPAGLITTFAGTGTCGTTGDGGPATSANINPIDAAVGGNFLYLVEPFAHRVRRVDLTTRVISTFAGTGTSGFSGDGGAATAARLNTPVGVAIDTAGNVFISDGGNSVIRVVRGTTISTIAGMPGVISNDVESGPATNAAFIPSRLAVASDGSIYVADFNRDRIRRLVRQIPSSLVGPPNGTTAATAGTAFSYGVRVLDGSGSPVSGVTVTFALTSGTATLSSTSAVTDSNGLATITVTPGSAPEQIRISASAPSLPTSTLNANVIAPGGGATVAEGGVVGAGLSVPAIQALSTGSIASIFGRGFGAGATFVKVGSGDLVLGRVPTLFRGVCVDVAGQRAPVFGASDTQVNFQVPVLPQGATASVRVITDCNGAAPLASNTITIPVKSATPEFFYFTFAANGVNAVAATDAATGALLAPGGQFPGVNPARRGQVITVYGTGFGRTNPQVAPGEFFPNIAAASSVKVFLDGNELAAENVLYAGVTPASPGLFQLNLRLPSTLRAGNLPLVIEVDGNRSSPGGFLAVAP